MKQFIMLMFAGLAVYHSLEVISGSGDDIYVNPESVKRSLNVSNLSSPFIQVRIPGTTDLAGKVRFNLVSEKQIRLNGHLFEVVGLSIFKGFIDLRLILNDSELTQKTVSISNDFNTKKGGVNFKSGPVFIPFTPPVPFSFNMVAVSDSQYSMFSYPDSDPFTGFVEISGPPPEI